jgi:hypothetical protein
MVEVGLMSAGWWSTGLVGEGCDPLAGEVFESAAVAGGDDGVGRLAVVKIGLAVVRFAFEGAGRFVGDPTRGVWSTSHCVIGASQPDGC